MPPLASRSPSARRPNNVMSSAFAFNSALFISSLFSKTEIMIGPESKMISKRRVLICNSSVSTSFNKNFKPIGNEIMKVAQTAIALDTESFRSSINTSFMRIEIGIITGRRIWIVNIASKADICRNPSVSKLIPWVHQHIYRIGSMSVLERKSAKKHRRFTAAHRVKKR